MASKSGILFFVNGKKIEDPSVNPATSLLQYLRQKLKLRGVKEGCGTGGCGACTVMLSWCERGSAKKIHHCAINACLTPICLVHGKAVTTVEGIGSTKTALHPVQERIAKAHGTQCGFCTPGFVMSMYALLRNNPQPSMEKFLANFQGNLCRCTGYRPILDGLKTFTKEFQCCQGDQYSKSDSRCCGDFACSKGCVEVASSLTNVDYLPYDASQEPIFPPELQLQALEQEMLLFQNSTLSWYLPVNLKEAIKLKKSSSDALFVAGSTSIVFHIRNVSTPLTVISIGHLAELQKVEWTNSGVNIGAGVTMTTLEDILNSAIKDHKADKTKLFKAAVSILDRYAGPQIRNVATIGGSIASATSQADLNPLWLAGGASITVLSSDGVNSNVPIDEKFFIGKSKTILKPDEIIKSIFLPFSSKEDYVVAYKQSNRREFDTAVVVCAFKVHMEAESNKIKFIRASYGGIGPTTVAAVKTAETLTGRTWNDEMFQLAYKSLNNELNIPDDNLDGMVDYRNLLVTSLFYKFYLHVLQEINEVMTHAVRVKGKIKRGIPKSSQVFEIVQAGQSEQDPLGRPLVHSSALEHATGEAVYCDDTGLLEDELHLGLVISRSAHARIKSVDTSASLATPGVVSFIDYHDIPGNNIAAVDYDQPLFAKDEVRYVGELIGAVVAESRELAQRAARLVKIEYEDLPAILTIEDAIKENSFEDVHLRADVGHIDDALARSKHIIEGEFRTGGQQHFYMENQSAICVPTGEKSEMEILSSTQNTASVQMSIANILGISANRIVTRTKRLGGAFGGKETDSILAAGPCAVAAFKLGHPVRCVFNRAEDFLITGGRHEALFKYKIGFGDTGKIHALDFFVYLNGGYVSVLSRVILGELLFHSLGCYTVPNVRFDSAICVTNIANATAFRGFGIPQAHLFIENCITKVAEKLDISALHVRQMNLFHAGDICWNNFPIQDNNCQQCVDECIELSQFSTRYEQALKFNRDHRWQKRALHLLPIRFGIPYAVKFLNQAMAVVHIYTDGSVLLTYGGIEMGQGLHVKMLQVASRVLQVPVSRIQIGINSSDKIPNTVTSSASCSSDLWGGAIVKACQTINDRLEPYKTAKPDDTWEQWVKAAYLDRINLSATGFYAPECSEYDWKTKKGYGNLYLTYGAACSEVEIDVLTGDHILLRTDIVMDVGQSLNPAIDIGQIEGGFLQGYGYVTLEEVKYTKDGLLINRNPGTYKIPGFNDIPTEFNIALLRNSSNPKAVYSSKGIGEPPLLLGASVFFAIRDAVMSARSDAGCHDDFDFFPPATAEKIRIACGNLQMFYK